MRVFVIALVALGMGVAAVVAEGAAATGAAAATGGSCTNGVCNAAGTLGGAPVASSQAQHVGAAAAKFRLADRMMIQDWFVKYAHCVDSRAFDSLETLFSDDAVLNYTSTAGVAGSAQEMSEWLTVAFTTYLGRTMHHISNVDVRFTGANEASARAMLYNPVLIRWFSLTPFIMVGGWYEASFTRASADEDWLCSSLDFDLAYNTATWSLFLVGLTILFVVLACCGRLMWKRGLSRPAAMRLLRRARAASTASRGRRRSASGGSGSGRELLNPSPMPRSSPTASE